MVNNSQSSYYYCNVHGTFCWLKLTKSELRTASSIMSRIVECYCSSIALAFQHKIGFVWSIQFRLCNCFVQLSLHNLGKWSSFECFGIRPIYPLSKTQTFACFINAFIFSRDEPSSSVIVTPPLSSSSANHLDATTKLQLMNLKVARSGTGCRVCWMGHVHSPGICCKNRPFTLPRVLLNFRKVRQKAFQLLNVPGLRLRRRCNGGEPVVAFLHTGSRFEHSLKNFKVRIHILQSWKG